MSRVTVDASFLSQLPAIATSVEVCDDTGHIVGWLVLNPLPTKHDYDEAWSEHDPAQIERARQEPGGLTTEEVLKRLAKL